MSTPAAFEGGESGMVVCDRIAGTVAMSVVPWADVSLNDSVDGVCGIGDCLFGHGASGCQVAQPCAGCASKRSTCEKRVWTTRGASSTAICAHSSCLWFKSGLGGVDGWETFGLFGCAGSGNPRTVGGTALRELCRQVVQGGQLAGEEHLVEVPAK